MKPSRTSAENTEALHQLLVVVLDINPNQLLFARQPGSFSRVVSCVTTLLSQHMMLHPTNQVRAKFLLKRLYHDHDGK